MTYRTSPKKVAQIRILGPDHKGIIATITNFLFKNALNIEDIDQRILDGYLIMNMVVDLSDLRLPQAQFIQNLKTTAASMGMGAELRTTDEKRLKNVALLVTKEKHCAQDILEKIKKKIIRGIPVVIIGNHPDLKSLAKKYRVPFFHVPSHNRKEHETRVLKILHDHEVDLVVLARYMQILSPDFAFRYEGRIINIHPSLLPAFPGPRSYHQAFNKGVEVVGVTAHFVTMDLDEGPIICQESFRVNKSKDTIEAYIERGRKMEARVLSRAVQLFLANRLYLRRGKVIFNKQMNALAQKTHSFYQ